MLRYENLFFEQVYLHLGISGRVVKDMDTIFLSAFWSKLRENMEMKLKRSTTFHPQKNGQKKAVNRILANFLMGYNKKHSKT